MNMQTKTILMGLMVLGLASACEKSGRTFSLMSENASFSEAPTFTVTQRKVDILWVIDNSDSMASSQQALIDNFQVFINRFQNKQYDFHMAVTTSDAYRAAFYTMPKMSLLRDGKVNAATGNEVGTHSGVRVMTNDTPNLTAIWALNSNQGTIGSGDERAFASIKDTLNNSANSAFRRADAFLAIINVSDEDDFSATTSSYIYNDYSSSNLIPVSYYKNYLDQLVGAHNYSFSTISILTETCKTQLTNEFQGRIIGQRYIQLADQTGGAKTSLCDNFGTNLNLISDTIATQNPVSAVYTLTREPNIPTLSVRISGNTIANNAVNGWTYDVSTKKVTLHGTAVDLIQAGGSVTITYDPLTATD